MSEEEEAAEPTISPELFSSTLKTLVLESHEIYEELLYAGFPEKIALQIIAHMLTDVVLYREPYDAEDDDDEDSHEDDDTDEHPI